MRVESVPELTIGDQFTLGLYGPGQPEPLCVAAQVIREDPGEGYALEFRDIDAGTERALEKLVACLPDVESLDAGEAGSLGAVISEILEG